MTVYRLLWQLLKHVVRGRGRDEVFLSVEWRNERHSGGATGAVTGVEWEARREGFGFIDASDGELYSDSREVGPCAVSHG